MHFLAPNVFVHSTLRMHRKKIGPGVMHIRAIIEHFVLSGTDVKDDGRMQVSSFNKYRENAAI